jgi:ABC-2 type transport system ATP-binding protein
MDSRRLFPVHSITTKNINKSFGNIKAVDNVSLSIRKGEIFGLLGPNGAGKTTLISMLVTMRKPTSGRASVNGHDIIDDPSGVRKSIGIVFQDPSLDDELTAYENMDIHGAFYGIERDKRKSIITNLLTKFGLEKRMDDPIKTYSGGMKRRLEIARGLMHKPDILFLDEPTIGLDPQTRSVIWDHIRRIKEEHSVTIVLTTHYMEEADKLCDRLAIIDQGKVITQDTPLALKDALEGDAITIETKDGKELGELVSAKKISKDYDVHDGKVTFHVDHGEKRIASIISAADAKGIAIKSVRLRKPTLDDVFLKYTGRTIREEESSAKDAMRLRMKAWGRK